MDLKQRNAECYNAAGHVLFIRGPKYLKNAQFTIPCTMIIRKNKDKQR